MNRVLILVNDIDYMSIDGIYAEYSPYLIVSVRTETIMTGNEYIELEVDDKSIVENYLSFLKGEEFHMDEKDEEFFGVMGHPNLMEYPIDYWKEKLRSKWIRDNFYRLSLKDKDDGLYGLIKLDIINQPNIAIVGHQEWNIYNSLPPIISIDSERDGVVVAGGAALWCAGGITTCGDVDFFSLDKDKSTDFFLTNKGGYPDINIAANQISHNINSNSCVAVLRNSYSRKGFLDWYKKVTLIRRVYTCPSEVVHGFDLDISQFIIIFKDGVPSLYTTSIGMYAMKHKIQWYDQEMSSTTYITRLAKYAGRGYPLRLPLINRDNLVSEYEKRNALHYLLYCDPYMIVDNTKKYNDVGSILIIIAFGEFTDTRVIHKLLTGEDVLSTQWKSYTDPCYGNHMITSLEQILVAPWIEVNPMQQDVLSGILYPMHMENLEELYRQSPLYKKE
jgi:hypothetical protein